MKQNTSCNYNMAYDSYLCCIKYRVFRKAISKWDCVLQHFLCHLLSSGNQQLHLDSWGWSALFGFLNCNCYANVALFSVLLFFLFWSDIYALEAFISYTWWLRGCVFHIDSYTDLGWSVVCFLLYNSVWIVIFLGSGAYGAVKGSVTAFVEELVIWILHVYLFFFLK